jgi:tripartite-type tricarboxylate transporter receptor subunit TctC
MTSICSLSTDASWWRGRSPHVRRLVVSRITTRLLTTLLLVASVLSASGIAAAQEYPSRPIRLIVPFAAGGSIDMVPRVLAPAMTKELGQTVVIENRPGAVGKLGVIAARDAPPDGYTFGVANAVTYGLSPAINRNVGYDPVKDTVPMVWMGEAPNGFFVNAKVPARTIPQLAQLIRDNPGKYSYGSAGPGTGQHVMASIFLARSGLPISAANHLPYKGEGPALNDLVAGHVQFMITSGNKDFVDRGDLRILATTSKTRWFRYPDVPTATELGFPEIYYTGWVGLVAPLGTPQSVIDRVNAAVNIALKDPKVRGVLAINGYEPRGGTPADFHNHIAGEAKRWRTQVDKTGLTFN